MPAWTPTKVQFLYRHQNQRYYVRTFAGGKEKWTSLKTTLLSVAKNRMREHLDAAERQKSTGEIVPVASKRTFGEVTETDRHPLQASEIRPVTKAYREAGIKLGCAHRVICSHVVPYRCRQQQGLRSIHALDVTHHRSYQPGSGKPSVLTRPLVLRALCPSVTGNFCLERTILERKLTSAPPSRSSTPTLQTRRHPPESRIG